MELWGSRLAVLQSHTARSSVPSTTVLNQAGLGPDAPPWSTFMKMLILLLGDESARRGHACAMYWDAASQSSEMGTDVDTVLRLAMALAAFSIPHGLALSFHLALGLLVSGAAGTGLPR